MLSNFETWIDEYAASAQFMILPPLYKEHALSILVAFSRSCQDRRLTTVPELTQSLCDDILNKDMAMLNATLEIRRGIPDLLISFFEFLCDSGHMPQAKPWPGWIKNCRVHYDQKFRSDGSIKGETFKKNYTDINRNDPCVCGSGIKFKKCCMRLIS